MKMEMKKGGGSLLFLLVSKLRREASDRFFIRTSQKYLTASAAAEPYFLAIAFFALSAMFSGVRPK